MMGNLVDVIQTYNEVESNTIQYNMNGRARGVYYFVATGREGTVTKKVIIN